MADETIVKRIVELAGRELSSACLCFCGASGRRESLTRHAPQLLVIVDDDSERPVLQEWLEQVSAALTDVAIWREST